MPTSSPTRDILRFQDDFDRAQVYSTTPGHNGWTIKDTSSAGAPTYLNVTNDGGGAKLTMAPDSEAEILTLYQNDVLMLDLAHLQKIEWCVKVAGWDSVTRMVMGVGSAQADTADSVAVNAWFLILDATPNVYCETDDGTTDLDDKATSIAAGSTFKRYEIDFTFGLSDIRFNVDGQRVAQGTTFKLDAITAGQNVQPFLQIQKASGTGVGTVTIKRFISQQDYVAA